VNRPLNLGCGLDVRPGYINVDLYPRAEGVQAVDIEQRGSLVPFAGSPRIVLQDVLEHVHDPHALLVRCYQALTPGGLLEIRGPHFTCRDVATDLTHRRGFSSESFLLLDGWEVVSCKIGFEWWHGWLGWVNLHPLMQRAYEATALRIFPAKHVRAILRKANVHVVRRLDR